MKRKLIKYTKFIVSVVLIISLIAPSYAALSASDGSAFVTKAEFDSALADFNSRLTTFEAGINSKIDSQVTSYLDRNGIWSGKDQVVSSELVAGVAFPAHGYGFLYADCGNTDYYTTDAMTKGVAKGENYLFPLFNYKIAKTTKSGLLYMISNIKSNSTQAKDKRLCLENNGTGNLLLCIDYGVGSGSWTVRQRKTSSSAVTSTTISSMNQVKQNVMLSNQTGSTIFVAYPDSLDIASIFFVGNGEEVWARMWLNAIIGGSSDGSVMSHFCFCGMTRSKAERPVFKVTECQVY